MLQMTKQEVQKKIIDKVRIPPGEYFWKGTQLYCKVKGKFGIWDIIVDECVMSITYKGKSVEVVEP